MKPPLKKPLRERAACDSCEFGSLTAHDDSLLHCRRHAPSLINTAGGALFPVVKAIDWCGDYREEIDGQ